MGLLQKFRFFMEHGGVTAFMIIGSALALLAISLERLVVLYLQMPLGSSETIKRVRELILNRHYSQALQVCNQQPDCPEFTVMRATIASIDSGREAMKSALNDALIKVAHRAETRLQFLALVANAATLLGLLGTISGLIKTFSGIAEADATEKARLLGIGISEAMYATAAGLSVGLAAMILHTICASRADSIILKSQSAGMSIWTWIEQAERVKKHG